MRNEFKMFFYIVLLIFGKSNAFIVEDYSGAVASYNSNVDFLRDINNLKNHTTTSEFIFSDNKKKFVNGYANGNSFFIFGKFLSSKLYDYQLLQQINYIYDSKKITMDNIALLKQRQNFTIFGITADLDKVETKDLHEFTSLFYNADTIRHFIFQTLIANGKKEFISSVFKTNNWENLLNYFDLYHEFSDEIELYSTPIDSNLWFIIGKPNHRSVEEVIPLNYINDDLSLISYKVNKRTKYIFLIPINGLKFGESDIGAYLVKCNEKNTSGTRCKFWGQIINVVKISKKKQMVVGGFISTQLLNETSFLFKSQIRKTSISGDPSKENEAIIPPKGMEVDTSLLTDSSSLGIDKMKSTISTAVHKDEDTLDDELQSKSKRHKPNSFDKKHLSLFGVTCEEINILGKYTLTPVVTINVKKIDHYALDMIFKVYNIEGVYIINGDKFEFNLCYESLEGDYLI